jgi:hypothetical protein
MFDLQLQAQAESKYLSQLRLLEHTDGAFMFSVEVLK